MNETDVRSGEIRSMRKTKIVCTLGPASRSPEMLETLILAGMNVARLNFSHGTREEHGRMIRLLRDISARLGRPLAILQDLCGPKIRTGALVGGKEIVLEDGAEITITTSAVPGTATMISTTYADLPRDIRSGDRILLADGQMELQVLAVEMSTVRCRVIHGGVLGEHKGINLPGVKLSTPAITAKDADDLKFGVREGVDYLAISFVRCADDLLTVKRLLSEMNSEIPVIAKIEKPEAVENLESILSVCEGVMVARGDLGVEVNPEKVPMLQKQIIEAANRHGSLVITATQMLESMISNPRPTRAEASDVANAILDGTDAVMLSAETSVGRYPVEAVRMMGRIAVEAEASGRGCPVANHSQSGYSHAIAHAACSIAANLDLNAICAFTQSGYTARLVSKERPSVPVLAFTHDLQVYHRASLFWGVLPLMVEFACDTDDLFHCVEKEMIAHRLASKGDTVAILGGMPSASRGATNFLKIHEIAAFGQDR